MYGQFGKIAACKWAADPLKIATKTRPLDLPSLKAANPKPFNPRDFNRHWAV
jgi:hypothetical protein